MKLPRQFSQKARKVFYFIHLWTGLLLGFWLVLMGLTGSLLSWRAEMTEWETRQRVSAPVPDANAAKIPVSQAIAALKEFNTELNPERGMNLPVSKTGYYLHNARGEVNGEHVTMVYLVNPVTARVYPPVNRSTLWIDITERFHHNLLVGVKGTVTNGFFTFFTLFMLISGAWLWWPSNLAQLRQRTLLKSGINLRRTLYDLHNMSGVYLFGVLFLITLTGVIIDYNGQTDQSVTKWISRLGGVKEEPRRTRGEEGRGRGPEQGRGAPTRTDGRKPLPIDTMVEKARAALPNNTLVAIRAPRRPGQPFRASYDLVRITSGDVPFDPYTGERIRSSNEAAFNRPASPGTKVMGAVFHLHYGWYGGYWTKVVYCLTGFMPLILFITGVWMWIHRKQGQARMQTKKKLRNQASKAEAKELAAV